MPYSTDRSWLNTWVTLCTWSFAKLNSIKFHRHQIVSSLSFVHLDRRSEEWRRALSSSRVPRLALICTATKHTAMVGQLCIVSNVVPADIVISSVQYTNTRYGSFRLFHNYYLIHTSSGYFTFITWTNGLCTTEKEIWKKYSLTAYLLYRKLLEHIISLEAALWVVCLSYR